MTRLHTKIFLPFAVLTIAVALSSTLIVWNLLQATAATVFHERLITAGKDTNDGILFIESTQTQVLRALAGTDELAAATRAGNARTLESMLGSLTSQPALTTVGVVNRNGQTVWMSNASTPLHGTPTLGAQAIMPDLTRVQADAALSDLLPLDGGQMLATTVGIKAGAGAIFAGIPISGLVAKLASDTSANIAIYASNCAVISASSDDAAPLDQLACSRVFGESHLAIGRPIVIGNQPYNELVSGLATASGVTVALGVALPTNELQSGVEHQTLAYIVIISLLMMAILGSGILVSRSVVRSIQRTEFMRP
jgi:hypothetical protein